MSPVEQEMFNLRGQQQLIMGIHSCSGPIGEEKLQAVKLGGELEMCWALGISSTFAVNRC